MQGRKAPVRYKSVIDFIARTGLKKGFVAESWGVSSFQMTALCHPGRYSFALDDEQWGRIAGSLNQPINDVKVLYGKQSARAERKTA